MEWKRRITPLDEKAAEFVEKYFDDMRLAQGSIVEKYLWLYYTDGHKEYSLPDFWQYQLDVSNYSFKIGQLDNAAGETDNIAYTVTIDREHENDNIILLHELIHVFQGLYAYRETPPIINLDGEKISAVVYPFIRDVLFIELYNKLKNKINNLDALILEHANIHSGVSITNIGGNHDVLFLLKSLDLDLRLNYPLGTVCGYDRETMFNVKAT